MNHSIENKYVGKLRTSSTHLNSGKNIITDAPIDNNGKGEAFAPTDLVSSALCSCMTTVMGICAEKGNFEMPNSTAKITFTYTYIPIRAACADRLCGGNW